MLEANGPMTPLWTAGRPAVQPVASHEKPKKKPMTPTAKLELGSFGVHKHAQKSDTSNVSVVNFRSEQ